MKIKGAVALVTGANRGLGKAFAQALLDAGASKVYGGARNPKSITVPGVIPVQLDVTKLEQIQAAARILKDVNLVINNAGIFRVTALADDDLNALARESMETNYFGVVSVTQVFAPILAANGGGTIANMLSALSWAALPGTLVYSASKAAALLFTNAIREELKVQGTQVTAIHAGYIDTDMAANVESPKLDPVAVAKKTVEGLEAGRQEILIDEISKMVKSRLNVELPLFAN